MSLEKEEVPKSPVFHVKNIIIPLELQSDF